MSETQLLQYSETTSTVPGTMYEYRTVLVSPSSQICRNIVVVLHQPFTINFTCALKNTLHHDDRIKSEFRNNYASNTKLGNITTTIWIRREDRYRYITAVSTPIQLEAISIPIVPFPNNAPTFANSLFKMDPLIKRIFGFDVDQVINPYGLHGMAILINGQNIIQMLNTIFSVLGPDTDLLQEVLLDIGYNHCKLGLSPDHFMLLCRALLEVVAKAMGDDWTAELKRAWFQVIRFLSIEISKTMQKRMLESCEPIA